MAERTFFDTNVLVYTDDADAPEKASRALDLWQARRTAGQAVISVQVLSEYYAVTTRKLGVDPLVAIEKLGLFARADVVVTRPDDTASAARLSLEHRLSYWDALIIQAAQNANCQVLLSEDLQAGRRFRDLEVVDPF